MHRLSSLLLLLVSAIVLASCGSSDPEPSAPQTARKTIFVFMPYTGDSNNLYSNLQANLNDMSTAIKQNGGLSGNHLIVFISKDASTSHLVDFSYKKGNCVRDTLKTYTTASYTSAEGIAALLGDVRQYAPAQQYATIVGCHGEGWIPKNITRFFGGTRNRIDVTDFAQGILSAGMKMQFILFDDCYMSGVEVAYDLRNAADYLIASTSEMMDYGMPYHKILKYLLADTPDYESLCRDFISFYQSYPMPYGTIAVTDLAYIDEMAALMKGINATHQLDPANAANVQDLDVLHYTPTVYFDFGSYVGQLCGSDAGAYAQFAELESKLVPWKGNTDYIYSWSGSAKLRLNEYSGLTVSDLSENIIAADTKQQTAWWKATH